MARPHAGYFVSYYTLICCVIALLRTSYGYVSPLAPYGGALFKIGFAYASGPLSWSARPGAGAAARMPA